MQIRTVNPGMVLPVKDGWKFTISINNQTELYTCVYPSANETKQAMREMVRELRMKHGIGVEQ